MDSTTKYQGRSQTQLANTDGISALMAASADEYRLSINGKQTELSDVDAVKRVAVEYMRDCAERGALPTVRGVASRLGVTRQSLYARAKRHPGGAFSLWLEDFSDCCAETAMIAAMAGNIREVSAIFVAKARYGWREAPTQFEIGQLNGGITGADTQEAAVEIATRYSELPQD